MARLIEAFGTLCGEATERGTKVGFELMPFAVIRTLEASLRLVEGAGARNGGICLDTRHIVKLKAAYDELRRIPPHHITGAELNDGTLECSWSLHEDTVYHRRLCGEGEFDVKGFIRAIQDAGYEGPWGIEVLSDELRKWPLERLTTRAFQTTTAQFSPPSIAARNEPGSGDRNPCPPLPPQRLSNSPPRHGSQPTKLVPDAAMTSSHLRGWEALPAEGSALFASAASVRN